MRSLYRFATFGLTAGLLLSSAPAMGAGDRAAEVRLIHGTSGLRGRVQWGDPGLRLDFAYPVAPGRTADASLTIEAGTGHAWLMLHGTQQVVEGSWPLGDHPSPLDLLRPGLDELRMDTVGRVVVGQLECDVKEASRGAELRVWYPTAFPDIPRMARLISEEGSSELSISKVRPGTFSARELAVPEGYEILPFDLTDLMVKATESQDAAQLGARAVVWMASANLEQQLRNVEYRIMVDVDWPLEEE